MLIEGIEYVAINCYKQYRCVNLIAMKLLKEFLKIMKMAGWKLRKTI